MSHYTDFPVYPTDLLNATDYPSQTDDVDYTYAWLINALKDEMIAVQKELGTLPKGAYADLKTRLDNLPPSGDVFGPASATDNALARFNLTTGKLLQNGQIIELDSGIVNMPKQCCVRATRNTPLSIPNAADTTILFATVTRDTQSAYDPATGIFTTPADGNYDFKASILFESAAWGAAKIAELKLYIDNAAYSQGPRNTTDSAITKYQAVSFTDTVYLTAAQTAKIRIYQDNGAAINLYGSALFNRLIIVKVG